MDYRIGAQFNMKIDKDVLLLCYLDEICLTFTGNLWRALASLYSESEAIKGSQNGDSPSVDYTTFYRQHLCVNEGSRPQQLMWNSEFFVLFPAQIYCCTIVCISNILCGLKVIVSRNLQLCRACMHSFFHRLSILERATDHKCINDCSYSKEMWV